MVTGTPKTQICLKLDVLDQSRPSNGVNRSAVHVSSPLPVCVLNIHAILPHIPPYRYMKSQFYNSLVPGVKVTIKKNNRVSHHDVSIFI